MTSYLGVTRVLVLLLPLVAGCNNAPDTSITSTSSIPTTPSMTAVTRPKNLSAKPPASLNIASEGQPLSYDFNQDGVLDWVARGKNFFIYLSG